MSSDAVCHAILGTFTNALPVLNQDSFSVQSFSAISSSMQYWCTEDYTEGPLLTDEILSSNTAYFQRLEAAISPEAFTPRRKKTLSAFVASSPVVDSPFSATKLSILSPSHQHAFTLNPALKAHSIVPFEERVRHSSAEEPIALQKLRDMIKDECDPEVNISQWIHVLSSIVDEDLSSTYSAADIQVLLSKLAAVATVLNQIFFDYESSGITQPCIDPSQLLGCSISTVCLGFNACSSMPVGQISDDFVSVLLNLTTNLCNLILQARCAVPSMKLVSLCRKTSKFIAHVFLPDTHLFQILDALLGLFTCETDEPCFAEIVLPLNQIFEKYSDMRTFIVEELIEKQRPKSVYRIGKDYSGEEILLSSFMLALHHFTQVFFMNIESRGDRFCDAFVDASSMAEQFLQKSVELFITKLVNQSQKESGIDGVSNLYSLLLQDLKSNLTRYHISIASTIFHKSVSILTDWLKSANCTSSIKQNLIDLLTGFICCLPIEKPHAVSGVNLDIIISRVNNDSSLSNSEKHVLFSSCLRLLGSNVESSKSLLEKNESCPMGESANGAEISSLYKLIVLNYMTSSAYLNRYVEVVIFFSADDSAQLRLRCARSISTSLGQFSSLAVDDHLSKALNSRSTDASLAVREATIDCISKILAACPSRYATYEESLKPRLTDAGLNIRKKVLKLYRDLFFEGSLGRDERAFLSRSIFSRFNDVTLQDLSPKFIMQVVLGIADLDHIKSAVKLDVSPHHLHFICDLFYRESLDPFVLFPYVFHQGREKLGLNMDMIAESLVRGLMNIYGEQSVAAVDGLDQGLDAVILLLVRCVGTLFPSSLVPVQRIFMERVCQGPPKSDADSSLAQEECWVELLSILAIVLPRLLSIERKDVVLLEKSLLQVLLSNKNEQVIRSAIICMGCLIKAGHVSISVVQRVFDKFMGIIGQTPARQKSRLLFVLSCLVGHILPAGSAGSCEAIYDIVIRFARESPGDDLTRHETAVKCLLNLFLNVPRLSLRPDVLDYLGNVLEQMPAQLKTYATRGLWRLHQHLYPEVQPDRLAQNELETVSDEHGSAVFQAYAPYILANVTDLHADALQESSLELLQGILGTGLIHPALAVEQLMIVEMTGKSDYAKALASTLLVHLLEKHAGFSFTKYCKALRGVQALMPPTLSPETIVEQTAPFQALYRTLTPSRRDDLISNLVSPFQMARIQGPSGLCLLKLTLATLLGLPLEKFRELRHLYRLLSNVMMSKLTLLLDYIACEQPWTEHIKEHCWSVLLIKRALDHLEEKFQYNHGSAVYGSFDGDSKKDSTMSMQSLVVASPVSAPSFSESDLPVESEELRDRMEDILDEPLLQGSVNGGGGKKSSKYDEEDNLPVLSASKGGRARGAGIKRRKPARKLSMPSSGEDEDQPDDDDEDGHDDEVFRPKRLASRRGKRTKSTII